MDTTKKMESGSDLNFGINKQKMKDIDLYNWFLKHEHLFNVSEVEKLCNINAGSLSKAIKREQSTFLHSDKLIVLYRVFYPLE